MATASSDDHDEEEIYDEDLDDEGDSEEEGDDNDDGDDEDDGEPPPFPSAGHEAVLRRLTADEVRIRVHRVEIRGCGRTRRAAVEAAVGQDLVRAATVRELVRAAAEAGERLNRLGAFDAVSITLDAAPPGLPANGGGAVVVLVDVAEARGSIAGDLGVFANPEARSCSVEGSLKLKNLFGYCETWDASGALGFDQTLELNAGVAIPRIGAMPTPLMARMSFLSEDWLKSSLREHIMGVSIGLLSTLNHNLAYNLSWKIITNSARMSSTMEQLGHSLLSSIKYTYKVDKRDSSTRPTQGYAFLISSQVGGLAPENRSARFIRQEFDLRVALPLRVLNGALNAGVAAGIIHPLMRASPSSVSLLPERFYLGGNRSLVCCLGGPSSLVGFKARGLGSTDLRTCGPNNSGNGASTSELDAPGGDVAVTAFADLSFDLPLKPLRELGIHGHAFVSAGNLAKLTEHDLWRFPLTEFLQTFRSSAGFGIVVPTRLFRIEMNYCHILKQFGHDRGKTGLEFNFSAP